MEYEYELYHHGIKGMKWGIRRYQKKDGSLTPAGRKRYSDNPELKKQKDEMKAAKSIAKNSKKEYGNALKRYQIVSTKNNRNEAEKALNKYRSDNASYQKSKLQYTTNKEVARLRDNGKTFNRKSKHRLNLEEQYKKMGMNAEEAQAAANNRIRTEKILAASAALTVAACAAYIGTKQRKNRIDGIIKAGETLQRIEMRDTGGKLHDVFYTSKGKHDNIRYERLLGYARRQSTGHAYMMKLEAVNDIKVASKQRAIKTFEDLYKNDTEFRNGAMLLFGGNPPISAKMRYEKFNRALVGMKGTSYDKKFYDKLKSEGYGAIQDINDMKYSGYNAKNPLIVFDNVNKNIMVKSVKEMTGNLSKGAVKEHYKATGETLAKEFLEKAGPLSAAALSAKAVSTYASNPSVGRQFVANYKHEHPNTALTDEQILKMLYDD